VPIPEGLHELEYARNILEEVLAWPAIKSNLELIGGCIRSISKAKQRSFAKAHGYLMRAIDLAKKQAIPVDRFFFQDGVYMEIRPAKPNTSGDLPWFKPPTLEERVAFEAHKQTPEYKAAQQELERAWKKLAGRTAML
jgi:hypothetical protein